MTPRPSPSSPSGARTRRYLPGIRHRGRRPRRSPLDLARQAPEAELVALALPAAAYAATACRADAAARRARDHAREGPRSGDARAALRRRRRRRRGTTPAASRRSRGRTTPRRSPSGQPAATRRREPDPEIACVLQKALSTTRFRVYASSDVRGVQLCGAAKNVIAIAAGICDGLGFGDNARSALITRGLAEMTRLGSALGADPRTYAGLAGLGDLVATCTSRHSRNRARGRADRARRGARGRRARGGHGRRGAAHGAGAGGPRARGRRRPARSRTPSAASSRARRSPTRSRRCWRALRRPASSEAAR